MDIYYIYDSSTSMTDHMDVIESSLSIKESYDSTLKIMYTAHHLIKHI